MLFPLTVVLTLPLTIMTAPLTIAAAAFLRPTSRLTTLYGALAGLLTGGPWARATHQMELSNGATLLRLVAGGAAFAQPLWALCIRERAAFADVGLPCQIRAWWGREPFGVKVPLCVAGVTALLFSA